ncbi:MAG: methionyl-tRNA formyltransferase [Chloroflexota bacterium]
MRVLFMSTPEFGVPTLRKFFEQGYEIVGVVCQPDKPAGRGRQLIAPAIKRAALEHGLPIFQPDNLRAPEVIAALAQTQPELILVAAYGKYIPDEILNLPTRGALNLHPSLLPRWRGACPVTAAIAAGDAETGVTIHFVASEMDTGDILAQASVPLGDEDTTETMMARLAVLGADLYADTVARWLRGEIVPRKQDHTQATWCDRMTKAQGKIDWTQPAEKIARQVRAYQPWPLAYTFWRGQQLNILNARALNVAQDSATPGQVIQLDAGIVVATGNELILLRQVQLSGKRALPIADFARGARGFVGSVLGDL